MFTVHLFYARLVAKAVPSVGQRRAARTPCRLAGRGRDAAHCDAYECSLSFSVSVVLNY